jgi:hypothetical protein
MVGCVMAIVVEGRGLEIGSLPLYGVLLCHEEAAMGAKVIPRTVVTKTSRFGPAALVFQMSI